MGQVTSGLPAGPCALPRPTSLLARSGPSDPAFVEALGLELASSVAELLGAAVLGNDEAASILPLLAEAPLIGSNNGDCL
jgi:hypothetical protein